jgi:hypothetical protein
VIKVNEGAREIIIKNSKFINISKTEEENSGLIEISKNVA